MVVVPSHPDKIQGLPPPPPSPEHEDETIGEDIYLVESILDEASDDDGTLYFLVKWQGYPEDEATWEPQKNIIDEDLISEWRFKNKNKHIQSSKKSPKPSTSMSKSHSVSPDLPSKTLSPKKKVSSLKKNQKKYIEKNHSKKFKRLKTTLIDDDDDSDDGDNDDGNNGNVQNIQVTSSSPLSKKNAASQKSSTLEGTAEKILNPNVVTNSTLSAVNNKEKHPAITEKPALPQKHNTTTKNNTLTEISCLLSSRDPVSWIATMDTSQLGLLFYKDLTSISNLQKWIKANASSIVVLAPTSLIDQWKLDPLLHIESPMLFSKLEGFSACKAVFLVDPALQIVNRPLFSEIRSAFKHAGRFVVLTQLLLFDNLDVSAHDLSKKDANITLDVNFELGGILQRPASLFSGINILLPNISKEPMSYSPPKELASTDIAITKAETILSSALTLTTFDALMPPLMLTQDKSSSSVEVTDPSPTKPSEYLSPELSELFSPEDEDMSQSELVKSNDQRPLNQTVGDPQHPKLLSTPTFSLDPSTIPSTKVISDTSAQPSAQVGYRTSSTGSPTQPTTAPIGGAANPLQADSSISSYMTEPQKDNMDKAPSHTSSTPTQSQSLSPPTCLQQDSEIPLHSAAVSITSPLAIHMSVTSTPPINVIQMAQETEAVKTVSTSHADPSALTLLSARPNVPDTICNTIQVLSFSKPILTDYISRARQITDATKQAVLALVNPPEGGWKISFDLISANELPSILFQFISQAQRKQIQGWLFLGLQARIETIRSIFIPREILPLLNMVTVESCSDAPKPFYLLDPLAGEPILSKKSSTDSSTKKNEIKPPAGPLTKPSLTAPKKPTTVLEKSPPTEPCKQLTQMEKSPNLITRRPSPTAVLSSHSSISLVKPSSNMPIVPHESSFVRQSFPTVSENFIENKQPKISSALGTDGTANPLTTTERAAKLATGGFDRGIPSTIHKCYWLGCKFSTSNWASMKDHMGSHLPKITQSGESLPPDESMVVLQARCLSTYQQWSLQLLTENDRLKRSIDLLKAQIAGLLARPYQSHHR